MENRAVFFALLVVATLAIAFSYASTSPSIVIHKGTNDAIYFGSRWNEWRRESIPLRAEVPLPFGMKAIINSDSCWEDGRQHFERCLILRKDGSTASTGRIKMVDCTDYTGMHKIFSPTGGWYIDAITFDPSGIEASHVINGTGLWRLIDMDGNVISESKMTGGVCVGMWLVDDRRMVYTFNDTSELQVPSVVPHK